MRWRIRVARGAGPRPWRRRKRYSMMKPTICAQLSAKAEHASAVAAGRVMGGVVGEGIKS